MKSSSPIIVVKPSQAPQGDVRIFEYGVRLDSTCIDAADAQIKAARALYYELVAATRGIYDEMQAFVVSKAGESAQQLQTQIDDLSIRFDAARAANDESAMRDYAGQGACFGESSRRSSNRLVPLTRTPSSGTLRGLAKARAATPTKSAAQPWMLG